MTETSIINDADEDWVFERGGIRGECEKKMMMIFDNKKPTVVLLDAKVEMATPKNGIGKFATLDHPSHLRR